MSLSGAEFFLFFACCRSQLPCAQTVRQFLPDFRFRQEVVLHRSASLRRCFAAYGGDQRSAAGSRPRLVTAQCNEDGSPGGGIFLFFACCRSQLPCAQTALPVFAPPAPSGATCHGVAQRRRKGQLPRSGTFAAPGRNFLSVAVPRCLPLKLSGNSCLTFASGRR